MRVPVPSQLEKVAGRGHPEERILGTYCRFKIFIALPFTPFTPKTLQIVEICKALTSKSVTLRKILRILGNLAWAIQAIR
jgi:hypothetical protein